MYYQTQQNTSNSTLVIVRCGNNHKDYVSQWLGTYFNGLVQERCNSIANALELHLSCTNPSTYGIFSIQE